MDDHDRDHDGTGRPLEDSPFSPWRQLRPGEPKPPPKPANLWVIDACRNLYREFAKLSVPPPVVDEMEMWQIAALFEDEEGSADGVDGEIAGSMAYKRAMAARLGQPEPEWEEADGPTRMAPLNPEFMNMFGQPLAGPGDIPSGPPQTEDDIRRIANMFEDPEEAYRRMAASRQAGPTGT